MKGDESMKPDKRENHSFINAVWVGVSISLLLSIVLAMLLAVLVVSERFSENSIKYAVPVITMIGTMIGSMVAGKKHNEKLAILAAAVGGIYLFLLVAVGVLFFDGGFHNLGLRLLSTAVGCVCSCAICIRGKGSGKKRKRPYR